MSTPHTMTVAELIYELQLMPQDLPVEINNHATGQISYIDWVGLFDEKCESFDKDDGDYTCVVLQTETWASEVDGENTCPLCGISDGGTGCGIPECGLVKGE